MDKYIKKAEILIEALPYIQSLAGKTVVIKYGGNAMLSDELKASVITDVTMLKFIGVNPILVHGGGIEIGKMLEKHQIESSVVNGLRVTDQKTMDVVQMTLIGNVNKEIVSLLNVAGGKAIGLSGIDGGLIKCKKLESDEVDYGFVGEIIKIDAGVLEMLAQDEYIPVIASVGVDNEGKSYNINADTVASAIAAELQAEKLMFLTDVPGIRKDPNSEDIIFEISKTEAGDMIQTGQIDGGMIPKVMGCIEAINAGVKRVHIIDGRIPHCLLLEIFTNAGIGTMITGG